MRGGGNLASRTHPLTNKTRAATSSGWSHIGKAKQEQSPWQSCQPAVTTRPRRLSVGAHWPRLSRCVSQSTQAVGGWLCVFGEGHQSCREQSDEGTVPAMSLELPPTVPTTSHCNRDSSLVTATTLTQRYQAPCSPVWQLVVAFLSVT